MDRFEYEKEIPQRIYQASEKSDRVRYAMSRDRTAPMIMYLILMSVDDIIWNSTAF